MEQGQAWLVVRKLRLATGLILFAYVLTHLLNHAAGLVSLATAETVRVWFLAVWRNWPGTILLYGSLLSHLFLALWSIYRRRTLKMPAWEAAQLIVGLCIPPLLLEHVIGTRALHEIADIEDNYTYIGLVLWLWVPEKGVQQVVTLAVAWLHGCIGLHFWLRLKPWYRRGLPLVYAAALLIPVLSTLGFVDLGREIAVLARDPDWLGAAKARIGQPSAAVIAGAKEARDLAWAAMAALLAATLALRAVRLALDRRRGLVGISYPNGKRIELYPGMTVLEASRMAGVPHASVCGGRGRCSTCRVRIDRGLDGQPPASEGERKVLARVGAAPNVRLACQLRPTADVWVTPLLPPDATPAAARARPSHLKGEERGEGDRHSLRGSARIHAHGRRQVAL
jgi:adenylate cyclase